MIRTAISSLALLFCVSFAPAAFAEPAVYEIPTSGVTCGGSAAHAEAAVRRAGDVQSVKADPQTHVVVASFDTDVTSLDAILASLEASGAGPGEPKRIN